MNPSSTRTAVGSSPEHPRWSRARRIYLAIGLVCCLAGIALIVHGLIT